METTIAILSLVIIVLCGALIWMYFFGNAKVKPSDIVDLVDYKIKLNQLCKRIDQIDKDQRLDCRSVGVYPSKDKTYRELSSELRYQKEKARELDTKLKAIDFETPKHNNRSQFGNYEDIKTDTTTSTTTNKGV